MLYRRPSYIQKNKHNLVNNSNVNGFIWFSSRSSLNSNFCSRAAKFYCDVSEKTDMIFFLQISYHWDSLWNQFKHCRSEWMHFDWQLRWRHHHHLTYYWNKHVHQWLLSKYCLEYALFFSLKAFSPISEKFGCNHHNFLLQIVESKRNKMPETKKRAASSNGTAPAKKPKFEKKSAPKKNSEHQNQKNGNPFQKTGILIIMTKKHFFLYHFLNFVKLKMCMFSLHFIR